MSVERKQGVGLRLACDGEWCSRKFSPKATVADAADLRWRATLYGWLTEPCPEKQPTLPGVGTAVTVRDLCPECRRGK